VHRNALYDVQYQAYWQDDADESAEIAWINTIRDAMQPFSNGGYVNYIDADQSDWAAAYYGSNLSRLSTIKAAYDPQNVFNGPLSIPGADA
jgi:FAD/FMN-containing dehydrogenase